MSGEELSEEDQKFLETSRAFEQISKSKPEAADVLKSFLPELQKITSHSSIVIREVQAWVGSEPRLIQQLCQQLIIAGPIPPNTEVEHVANWVQTHWVQDWPHQAAAERLKQIQTALRAEDEKCIPLLELYRRILGQESLQDINPANLQTLQNLGLIEEQKVANRLYANVFDQNWVDQELKQAGQRRLICGRFKEIEKLKTGNTSQTYLVIDKHLKNRSCLLREYTPLSNDAGTLEQTRYAIDRIFRDLEKLKGHDQIPEVLNFEDSGKFYTTQEFIEGENLDQEIQSGHPWHEAHVIDLLIEVLSILEFVHLQNLAHLNLKPANLRRRKQDGKIVLIDFGAFQEINHVLERAAINSRSQAPIAPQYTPSVNLETRSPISCDLYAVGMIGIQALMGLQPEYLSIDRTTGEVIWLYEVLPDRGRVQVSFKLAEILSKMIRHRPGEQYSSASEVIEQLHTLKQTIPSEDSRRKHAWLTNKRILAWGGAGLALAGVVAGVFGAWMSQQTLYAQQQIRQCNDPIRVQNASGSSQPPQLINHQVTISADQVIQACTHAGIRQSNNPEFSKNQGKAYLLLWKHESLLNNPNEAKRNLGAAASMFANAVMLQPTDPQALFYQGLTQSFSGDLTSAEQSYRAAVDRYINQNPKLQSEDLPILVKLISFLVRENDPTQEYAKADALFNQAYPLATNSANLIYNHGSLHARAGSYPQALNTFERVIQAEPRSFAAWRSKGFVHLLQGESDYAKAEDSLNQALKLRPNDPYTSAYLTRIKNCISAAKQPNRTACNGNDFTRDRLKPAFEQIFPLLPVYRCDQYPVLGIAENGKGQPLCSNGAKQ